MNRYKITTTGPTLFIYAPSTAEARERAEAHGAEVILVECVGAWTNGRLVDTPGAGAGDGGATEVEIVARVAEMLPVDSEDEALVDRLMAKARKTGTPRPLMRRTKK